MFKKRGSAGPGTAGCKINFPRGETTISVNVREEVREARDEVLAKYTSDVLGQRPVEWDQSIDTYPLKYNKDFSDARLTNTLKPAHLAAVDKRTLQGTTFQYDKTTYHAFDRGETTTGWDHSVVMTPNEKAAALQAADQNALTQTARRRQNLEGYVKPQDREAIRMAKARERAAKQQEEAAELERKYGADGVAQLEAAKAMRPLGKPRRRPKPTRDDLAAVAELPMTDSDDDNLAMSQFGSRRSLDGAESRRVTETDDVVGRERRSTLDTTMSLAEAEGA